MSAVDGALILRLSEGASIRFSGDRIEYGTAIKDCPEVVPTCFKHLEMETCSFEFVRSVIKGLKINSAADFGSFFEYGLDKRFNLRFLS